MRVQVHKRFDPPRLLQSMEDLQRLMDNRMVVRIGCVPYSIQVNAFDSGAGVANDDAIGIETDEELENIQSAQYSRGDGVAYSFKVYSILSKNRSTPSMT